MAAPTPTSAAGTATPSPLLLWSTNTQLKYRIQQLFCAGEHFVWCSPAFEGAALHRYAIGAGQPASSDPATIYRQLSHAVRTRDEGDAKIVSQKKTLKALAIKWEKDGRISSTDRDEIVAMVAKSAITDWKPLIYTIPSAGLGSRVSLVPRVRRASLEPEYTIHDLRDGEFHIIEPVPCP